MITLLVTTDGRADYLQRTIESFDRAVHGEITQRVMVDDSGDPKYAAWLKNKFPLFMVIHHSERMGVAQSVITGWEAVNQDAEFIFHLQDDFTFNQPIDLSGPIEVLKQNPKLAQMAFLRQPWSWKEKRAGGIFKVWPNYYEQHAISAVDVIYDWVKSIHLFTLNPSIYPRHIMRPIETGPGFEGRLTEALKAAGYHFGYWGKLDDAPLVEHIGIRRVVEGRVY